MVSWVLACAALFAAATAARGADVALYSIVKERQFAQTGDTPAQAPGDAFRFSAAVVTSSNGVVNSATVQRGAGGTVFPLTNSTPPGVLLFTQAFASQAALDAAFPSATSYTIVMQTGTDGLRAPQLTFGTLAYPNAPRVRSLASLQMADSQAALNLQWDAFTGATANDVIQVLIEDGPSNTVFSSPLAGSPGALNGLATGVTVPAGTLVPGRTYAGTLVFARVLLSANNFFIYPGVPGASVFAARTRFALQTAPRPATRRPTLRVISTTPSAMTISFDAEIGAAYRLLAATNPAQASWTTLLTTNAAVTNVTFTDGAVGLNKERYFRVVSP